MGFSTFAALATAMNLTPAQQHQELVETFYNLYKSVNGIKPRWVNTDDMTVTELVNDIEALKVDAREEAEYEQHLIDQKRGYSEEDITYMTITCGAPDRHTAIRWAKQSNK
jgi:hypothetical protein